MPSFAETVLRTTRCILRPWRLSDAPALPPIANTRDISWNVTNKFPYPYDEAAANKFLVSHMTNLGQDKWQFAIEVGNELAGGCGAYRGTDVQAHTATIGYWLGVKYWGQGLASECLAELVRYMNDQTSIEQLTADCFGWNPASRRVLEKNGFEQEGIRKGVVKKWGKVTDLWIYGKQLS